MRRRYDSDRARVLERYHSMRNHGASRGLAARIANRDAPAHARLPDLIGWSTERMRAVASHLRLRGAQGLPRRKLQVALERRLLPGLMDLRAVPFGAPAP